jgi:YNFM family putative membrane transporter
MISDRRRAAVALAGFCVFLNLYAPQSVLPLLSHEFAVGAGEASLAITASTLAIALMAPFAGTFADVAGRKRVIVAAMFALVVPTAMVALAPDIHALIFWRFVQGLVLPPIFAVTVAYIGEEWPAAEVIGVTGIYMSATSFGGFFGRLITGVLADLAGWRIAFFSLAVVTLLLALGVAALLEHERRFVRSPDLSASARQMLRHFRNPRLVATYAIGFGVLFTFIATFTYVNFHLAAPPFRLSATALGSIFVVYLGGSAITPWTGRAVARFGRRPLILATIGLWIGGLLLTLLPWLPAIVTGLAISATCGFLCQSVSTSFVALSAERGHSSAVGLYVTWYYVGGSVGGALPGLIWNRAGWPGCVAMVIAVLVLIAALVWRFWRPSGAPSAAPHWP